MITSDILVLLHSFFLNDVGKVLVSYVVYNVSVFLEITLMIVTGTRNVIVNV